MDADLFFILLMVAGMVGAVSSLALRKRERLCANVSFGAAGFAGIFGTVVAILVMTGSPLSIQLPFDTLFGRFGFSLDRLGAFFLLVISVVSVAVSIYSIG